MRHFRQRANALDLPGGGAGPRRHPRLRNALSERPAPIVENEGFAAIDIDRVVGQYQQVNLAPTNDRSVLGSLGQIAYLDGLARCDLRAIDHELNITPMSHLKMESPLAVTRRALEGGDHTSPASGRPAPQRPKRPGRLATAK